MKALDDLIRKGILQDDWDVKEKDKGVCQNFLKGRCNRSHQKPENKSKSKQRSSKAACYDFMNCKCKHGDKCIFSHDKSVIEVHKANNAKNNPLEQCRSDLEDKLCKFDKQCWHAHRSRVNPRKDADADLADKLAKIKNTCLCCGSRGHEVKQCNKLHMNEIKKSSRIGW